MMSARCAVDAWAMPNSGAAAVPGARDDHYQDNSLDSGVDGMRDSPNNSSDYIPEYILDASSNTTYLSGKFLGKGGFARVHELKDLSANKIFAGKIIPKSRITKPHHRDKIAREIDVHRSLRHRHVVGFHGCFEDDDNVYIVLENCPRQSLVHVLKHRVTLTEPEVRYFMLQLVEGVKFIHSQKIIHRDLKLGNMFLTEDMIMKIGDFGLAARSDTMSSSRVTICGTPNYIAPEVLGKMGHSFQADIWAMGCIMYAMLVGQPPFETSTLKETYCRISRNKYVVPPSLSSPARNLIARLLHPQPSGRPSLDQILSDDFFTNFGRIKVLPTYCCYRRPDFANEALLITRHTEQMDATNNRSEEGYGIVSSMSTLHIDAKPPRSGKVGMKSRREQLMAMDTSNESKLSRSQSLKDNLQRVSKLELGSRQKLVSAESNGKLASSGTTSSASASSVSSAASNSSSSGCHVRAPPQQQPAPPAHNGAVVEPDAVSGNSCNIPLFNHIAVVMLRMQEAVAHCLRVMPVDVRCNPTPIAGSQPLFISKWIDYSNKYGFGFQLSDRSIGVLFNDNTRIACTGNKKRIEFWDNEGGLSIFSHSNVPPQLEERYTLLRYFGKYMDENLTEGGGQGGSRGNKSPECVERVTVNTQGGSAIPHMRRWMRSSTAIIMHLSDGTVQMNFFKDHTKIVIAAAEGDEKHAQKPMILVTYINSQRCCTSYDVTSLALRGCEPLLRERLVYASSVLKDIIPGKEKQV